MFTISSKADKQTFISLRGLIKNNGFFKSAKQRKFMLNVYADPMADLKYLGITLKDTDVTYVTIDGYYQWCEYGARAIVPVTITFVIDDFGVRAQYKTGGNGNLRDGWSPDPAKCKVIWERDESIEKPVFNAPAQTTEEKSVSTSTWLGEVGKRLVVKGKITFAKCLGYSEWGSKWITIMEDDFGNQIKAWKYLGEKDQIVEIKGTVKEHDEYEGKKGTVLTRISILA